MAWDGETHQRITLAKLKFAPSDSVYAALCDYSDHAAGPFFFSADEDLENTLLSRDDPLINLGLARYATNETVLGTLYRRGREGTGDSVYDKGLRLGCLSNRALSRLLTGTSSVFSTVSDSEELRRIAHEGDEDEIAVLMQNPVARLILGLVYERKPPFDSVHTSRLREFVAASITNPGLNAREDSEDSPDLVAYGIHRGIFELLRTAPVEPGWLITLYDLLRRVDPQAAHHPNTDPREILARWGQLKMTGFQGEDCEGNFTSLSYVDEFRCMAAALYGKRYREDMKEFEVIGESESPDAALRCAFYGNATLTKEAMRTGYSQDKEAFTLAALSNTTLFHKRELRTELEGMISGDLRRMYVQRCEQIHRRWPNFDPRPISESGADVLDDLIESKQTDEMATLSRIESQMSRLSNEVASIAKLTVWGLLAVFAAIIYFNR